MNPDRFDALQSDWNTERPDLDPSSMGVVLRIQYMARRLGDQAADALGDLGLEWWEYDVLASLRRQGEPFELTASALARASLLTSGAMTNRVDRLIQRGLVDRRHDDRDRRRVLVRLTDTGLQLVDRATEARFDAADVALKDLEAGERRELDELLRQLVLAVDHRPET